MAINNITGSPVEGDNFFGREKELKYAWNHIRKGNSLILSAPRRVGKSSFAKKLLEIAKGEKWNTLEINLEEIKSEEGFVKLFIEKLQEESWCENIKARTGNIIGQILESIKPSIEYEGAKASFEWKNRKDDIYKKLKSLLDHEDETLIMIDEVTILLNCFVKNDKENGIKDVEFFLNWLRSFRQASGTRIRWIFCSSVGIDNFTSLHNISYTLNDMDPLPIGEFSKIKAADLINQLASSENLEFSRDQVNYILKKLGWNLPYFIQIFFSNINQLVKIHDNTISENTFDEAYIDLINEKHLNTWDERLSEYIEYEPYARMVLKNLSRVKEGEGRNTLYNLIYARTNDEEMTETILNKILYMLRNDGYLIQTSDDRNTFRSPLLRDFWFNRFAK